MDFPLLMGCEFCFFFSLSLSLSLCLFYVFLCISFDFFWSPKISLKLAGAAADSVRTLPHVMKYQTVIPQRLKDSSLSGDDDAATHQVTHSTELFYQFI